METEKAPQTAFGYYSDVAKLLRLAPEVTEATQREASKRTGGPVSVQSIQRYPQREFTELRNAARRVVVGAHARITAAYLLAQQHGDPHCRDRVRAEALHEVIVHGKPQSRAGMLALGATEVSVLKGGGEGAARRHLFLSSDEVLAAAVLLASHRGMNLSPIINASVPTEHEPGVLQLDIDKPRRGTASRFWAEIFVAADGSEEDEDGAGARAVRLIAEATDPARAHLYLQGLPARRLLVFWPAFSATARHAGSNFGSRHSAGWIPRGTTIDFSRLRRSVPDQGVAKEPSDHSEDTYLHYVRSDPETLFEHQEQAALGVQKLVDHARESLAVRAAKDREVDPDTDSVLVNCSDPQQRPDTGVACTTGFYSFLDCLQCRNAATVLRLLPRLMAALHVLEELRDSVGEIWERRFATHYYTMLAIVGRYTPAERELAAGDAGQHVPTILAALRHEVPE
ncbi:hypothetical protein [Arthrobacter sp. NPDC057259]|uniref:hypothetical protein n=1 Tax=Arthrobacter sp. NPDC057259 TaxID=3346073 RepID=UPI0036402B68